ncbi:MAG: fibronectin type III domain-containing protein [Bacteroidia bacterium]
MLSIVVLPAYYDTTEVTICEADLPFTWLGNTYSASGTYNDVQTALGGCDSISTLILTVDPLLNPSLTCGLSSTSSVEVVWTAVNGATSYLIDYSINGVPAQSGISQTGTGFTVNSLSPSDVVSFTITPVGGSMSCFESASISCTAQDCVPPVFDVEPIDQSVCSGYSINFSTSLSSSSSLQWQISYNGGGSFSDIPEAGVFTGTASSQLSISDVTGLDGIIVRLIANETSGACPAFSEEVTLTVNEPPLIGLTASDLVSPPQTELSCLVPTTTVVATGGSVYTWSGGSTPGSAVNSFDSPGTYTLTVQSAEGCESDTSINLTGDFQTYASSIDTSVCEGVNYTLPDGSTATTTGVYPVTLQAQNGCDSVITTNLNVSPAITASQDVSVCVADLPYSWNGNDYSAAGSYSVTLISAGGCDSVITLNLTVDPIVSPSLTCGLSTISSVQVVWPPVSGAVSYLIDYSINGSPAQTGISVTGTSYTVSNLNPGDVVSFTVTPEGGIGSCFGSSGIDCTAQDCVPPVFDVQPVSQSECDNEDVEFSASVSGETSLQWQISYDGGATFTDIIDNAIFSDATTNTLSIEDISGLDGVIIRLYATEVTGTCPVYSDEVTLTVYSQPNILLTASDLINPPITEINCSNPTTTIVASGGNEYEWSGGLSPENASNTFDTPGTYTLEVESSNGCEAETTITITGDFQTFASTVDTSICEGSTYMLPDGSTVNSEGSYDITLSVANGCDSVITTNLFITPIVTSTDVQTACGSYTWIGWGNLYFKHQCTNLDNRRRFGGWM